MSFYTAKAKQLMHTFRTKFQQPVIPAFMVRTVFAAPLDLETVCWCVLSCRCGMEASQWWRACRFPAWSKAARGRTVAPAAPTPASLKPNFITIHPSGHLPAPPPSPSQPPHWLQLSLSAASLMIVCFCCMTAKVNFGRKKETLAVVMFGTLFCLNKFLFCYTFIQRRPSAARTI